ncbi:PilN domain-containing protein [Actinoplanes sp. G11-F43]|uniref:PilN domain-containing protein n=1 Tax=Actinoplanes sp. G11-F43 TaxID=3424130 RepID=UPI003D3557FE
MTTSTTALMPVDPSVSSLQAARILSIRADLMPPEIREGRRSRITRSMVVVLLVATLAVLAAWYAQATVAKQNAEDEYNDTFQSLTTARASQKTDELRDLVEYQDGGTALNGELTTILANDVSWTNLVTLIRDRAEDTKVGITEIGAGLNNDSADAEAQTTTEIGTVMISGSAASKRVVADFVNELGDLKDLVNPFVSSVTDTDGRVSFTVTVTITDEAHCGRFTEKCPSGGK